MQSKEAEEIKLVEDSIKDREDIDEEEGTVEVMIIPISDQDQNTQRIEIDKEALNNKEKIKTEIGKDEFIDYEQIEIPDDVQPEDLNLYERRAVILQLIKEQVDPRALNYAELARKFDVASPRIYHDRDVLMDYIVEHSNSKFQNRTKVWIKNLTDKLFKAYSGDMDKDEITRAGTDASRLVRLMQSMGLLEAEPQKHELSHETTDAVSERVDKLIAEHREDDD